MKLKHLIRLLFPLLLIQPGCGPEGKHPRRAAIPHDTTAELMSHRHYRQEQLKKHKFATESEWDAFNKFKPFPGRKQTIQKHPGYKVMGWIIHSEGSAYKNYNFSILSGVIYFSYELNPETGGYTNIHSWKTTALADSARAHDCNLYLAVTNFGRSRNHTFLSNKKAQNNFILTLVRLLRLHGAKGVVLDFENVSGEDRQRFTEFLVNLSRQLRKINREYECILCLYAFDYHNVFDIKAIDPYTDKYIMTGYDFYGSFSRETGPVAPLHDLKKGQNHSLVYAVNNYLKKGIAPKKLILGLPYYGAEWAAKTKEIPSEVTAFISNPAYYEIKKKIQTEKISPGMETGSLSRHITENKNHEVRQTWFDDSATLALKYDWVKYKGLGGVAPWTLSYCGEYADLRELLHVKFGKTNRPEEENRRKKQLSNTTRPHHLSRANSMRFFTNNKHFRQEVMRNYTPWKHQSSGHTDSEFVQSHQIYGFYPFWNDHKGLKIDFGLYTRIGYFAAIPDPKTGKIRESFNWYRTDTKPAQRQGCKVDLIVANHSADQNSNWLQNPAASKTLIRELLTHVNKMNGDGVTLDFGNIHRKDRSGFTEWAAVLGANLKALDNPCKLNCMLPPVNSNEDSHFGYDYEKLNKHIDYFLLTAFDYSGRNSRQAGSNAPLYGNKERAPHNVHASILKYTSLGVPAKKLILVTPCFGEQWTTESAKIPSKATKYVKSISYADFASGVAPKSQRIFDSCTCTPCFIFRKENQTFQTWIDDPVSLALKCEYVKKHNLAGAGVWALGYDQKHQELTRVLAGQFTLKKRQQPKKKNTSMKLIKIITETDGLEAALWIADIALIFGLAVILLLSLRICPIRSFVRKSGYIFYSIGFGLFIVTYFLLRENKFSENDETIAITLFIGLVCILWVRKVKADQARKEYP